MISGVSASLQPTSVSSSTSGQRICSCRSLTCSTVAHVCAGKEKSSCGLTVPCFASTNSYSVREAACAPCFPRSRPCSRGTSGVPLSRTRCPRPADSSRSIFCTRTYPARRHLPAHSKTHTATARNDGSACCTWRARVGEGGGSWHGRRTVAVCLCGPVFCGSYLSREDTADVPDRHCERRHGARHGDCRVELALLLAACSRKQALRIQIRGLHGLAAWGRAGCTSTTAGLPVAVRRRSSWYKFVHDLAGPMLQARTQSPVVRCAGRCL